MIWWIFLLAFNSMPLSISLDLYWLFLGVVAWNPRYWLYVLLVPVACILPDFFFRNVRRCVCGGVWVIREGGEGGAGNPICTAS